LHNREHHPEASPVAELHLSGQNPVKADSSPTDPAAWTDADHLNHPTFGLRDVMARKMYGSNSRVWPPTAMQLVLLSSCGNPHGALVTHSSMRPLSQAYGLVTVVVLEEPAGGGGTTTVDGAAGCTATG
jgi:hypothetical protein